jgi:predicted Fe-Mo cluster-binding NifX family protein
MKRFINSIIALLVLLASSTLFAQAVGAHWVAVAANGKTPAAAVSTQAGRSPYFLFFDKQGVFVEAVDNPYKDASNAGIPAIDFLAAKGAKLIVAESFGAKIANDIKGKGLKPVEFKGIAKDAAQAALEPK